MRVAPVAVAVTLAVEVICEEVEWPDLSSVGMSVDLELNLQRVCLFKFVWLVVNKYDRIVFVCRI